MHPISRFFDWTWQKGMDRAENKLIERMDSDEFRRFEKQLGIEGLSYDSDAYPNVIDYVSSLHLVDMLQRELKSQDIVLPNEIKLLDVGAGNWSYVHTLYKFLNSGGRKAHITGIDNEAERYQESVDPLIKELDADYDEQDIFTMDGEELYDIVLMSHAQLNNLSVAVDSVNTFENMYQNIGHLMKKDAILIGIAYGAKFEKNIFKAMPPEFDRSGFTRYQPDIGPFSKTVGSIYETFHDNWITIAKKA